MHSKTSKTASISHFLCVSWWGSPWVVLEVTKFWHWKNETHYRCPHNNSIAHRLGSSPENCSFSVIMDGWHLRWKHWQSTETATQRYAINSQAVFVRTETTLRCTGKRRNKSQLLKHKGESGWTKERTFGMMTHRKFLSFCVKDGWRLDSKGNNQSTHTFFWIVLTKRKH